MKFDFSREWCAEKARVEDGAEIGAGAGWEEVVPKDVRRDAVLSDCGLYRYLLTRSFYDDSVLPTMAWYIPPKQIVFVMLNPSTADAHADDPTIRRCMGFAWGNGFNIMHVVNLYAGRATKPDDLFEMEEPVGPRNFEIWSKIKNSNATIVCAWGADRRAFRQAKEFVDLMGGRSLNCLGLTKDGSPRHPLYLKRDTPFQPYMPTGDPQ